MKKIWSVGIFIVIISSLLIGCSGKSDGENKNAEDNEEESNQDEVNENDSEENQNEANENDSEENQDEASGNNFWEDQEKTNENDSEEDIEEDTFADEVKVLNVETVLHDQDEVSEFKANEDSVIEHDELLYVEYDFITEVLDYELTYDEDNTFAEIFAGKGDFIYEPSHEDEVAVMMDLGQIYVEDLDKYENISEDEEELYKLIEYEGQLYISERLINVFMKSPLHYERRDQVLEVGLHSEAETIYDIGITDDSSSAEVTQNAPDVTIEGENHDGGVVLRDINSADKNASIHIDYNYSAIEGFIHNHSDDETIEIRFQYDEDKTLDAVDLEPGETHEFKYDVNGEAIFKVVAEGEPGTSSEAVIVGEVN